MDSSLAMRADGSHIHLIRRNWRLRRFVSLDISRRWPGPLQRRSTTEILVMRGDGTHVRRYGNGQRCRVSAQRQTGSFTPAAVAGWIRFSLVAYPGGAPRRIGEGNEPTVSPNGRLIAFRQLSGQSVCAEDIWLMRRDGIARSRTDVIGRLRPRRANASQSSRPTGERWHTSTRTSMGGRGPAAGRPYRWHAGPPRKRRVLLLHTGLGPVPESQGDRDPAGPTAISDFVRPPKRSRRIVASGKSSRSSSSSRRWIGS